LQYGDRHNGVYCVLLSRFVGDDTTSDPAILVDDLVKCLPARGGRPDLIIAGDSHLVVPFVPNGDRRSVMLFEQPATEATCLRFDNVAFGVGICALLAALDSVIAAPMPWNDVLNDALSDAQ
jgi:hypothetical protein